MLLCRLYWTAYAQLPAEVEHELGRWVSSSSDKLGDHKCILSILADSAERLQFIACQPCKAVKVHIQVAL